MASESSTDLTNTSTSSDSSTTTSKDMIEVSSFYHRQWAPDYPKLVNFRYDGITYQIRLRQHRGKVYFAEGLDEFKKYLSIFESVIIKFLACNNKSIFDLYFIPSLECQTCGRPQLMPRQYIWTVEITQSMLGAPGPLRLPNCAMLHVNACGQHLTILWRFGPPLQWNVVVVDGGVRRIYVVQPWYQFLADNDFSHGDENIIKVPLSYHRQWRPHYATYVLFQHNGTTHFIRLHRYGSRYFYSDGLKEFRRTHGIDDSVILRFFGGDKNTTFEVDVIGPIFGQRRPRSVLTTRRHIFTVDVTEHMMQQSLPLVLPPTASSFLFGSQKIIPVQRGYGKCQQWKITMHDAVPFVAQPWSQYLSENNLMPGDEVMFFFRFDKHVWEVVFRKEVIWDDEDLFR
ncbi:hypothetical protein JHK85_043699 [Glycine max]|nr:hypothetical protein JHK85_043699 [Glycine max]